MVKLTKKISLLIILLFLIPITLAEYQCEIIETSPSGSIGLRNHLIYGNDNNIHITHQDTTDSSITRYCEGTYGNWTCEDVAINTNLEDYMFIEKDNNFVISGEIGTNDLSICFGELGNWTCEVVSSATTLGSYSAVSYGSDLNYHVMSLDSFSGSSADYCEGKEGIWTCESMPDGYVETDNWMDTNTDGNIHISGGYNELQYCNGYLGNWTCEQVTADGGKDTTVLVGTDGNVHLFSEDLQNNTVRYCEGTSGKWACETILSSTTGKIDNVIELDGNFNFSFASNGDLDICTGVFEDWTCETIKSDRDYNFYSSLDINSSYHYVSFFDDAGNDLGYCQEDAIDPVIEWVDINSGWQNTDANVRIKVTDNVSLSSVTINVSYPPPLFGYAQYDYDCGDTNCEDLSVFLTSDGNRQIIVQAQDSVGNSAISINYQGIDSANPTASDDIPVGWQQTSINITITPYDATSGVAGTFYRLDSDSSSTVSLGGWLLFDTNILITADGNWALTYNVTDNADNNSQTYTDYALINASSPLITWKDLNTDWQNTDANVLISVTDVSGLSAVTLSVDDVNTVFSCGDVNCSDLNVFLTTDLNHCIVVNAQDILDANSIDNNCAPIDKTIPKVTSNAPVGWQASNVTLTISPNDALSGINKTFYRLDSDSSSTTNLGGWLVYSTPLSFTTDGNYNIVYVTNDNADNNSLTSDTNYILVDKTKPIIADDANTTWNLEGDANIHLTCSDANSGVNKTYYRIDDSNTSSNNWGAWQEYDANIFIKNAEYGDGNFAIAYWCNDVAGNDSNTDANASITYALLEVGLPTTPTSITPQSGNYTENVTVSCIVPTWIRDVNYVVDFNTDVADWNQFYYGSSSSPSLAIDWAPESTKMWFRCKIVDEDKNGEYLTATGNIVANPDTGFDSITNPVPATPTTVYSASAPFGVDANDASGVSFCTFNVYKNAISVGDFNGSPSGDDENNGTWSYSYTSVINGDIVYSVIYCQDGEGNNSSNVSTSTYSVNIAAGNGNGASAGGGGSSGGTYIPPEFLLDLNFDPPRKSLIWFYAPFSEDVKRTYETSFFLNQQIERCWTDSNYFECELEESYKINLTATFDKDDPFPNTGEVLRTKVFGQNSAGKIGATDVTISVINLGTWFYARFDFPANNPLTGNHFIFKVKEGKAIGIRLAFILTTILAIMVVGLIVFYRARKG